MTNLAEYDSVEGPVERELDLHVPLPAHDLQVRDVGHVLGPLRLPQLQPGPRRPGPEPVASRRVVALTQIRPAAVVALTFDHVRIAAEEDY